MKYSFIVTLHISFNDDSGETQRLNAVRHPVSDVLRRFNTLYDEDIKSRCRFRGSSCFVSLLIQRLVHCVQC